MWADGWQKVHTIRDNQTNSFETKCNQKKLGAYECVYFHSRALQTVQRNIKQCKSTTLIKVLCG